MRDIWYAILLGVVEGLTEFLPVSSTGHMLLVEQYLGLQLDEGFWKIFTVVIQLGAILAVVVYYRQRLLALVADFLAPVKVDYQPPQFEPLPRAGVVTLTPPHLRSVPRWRHPLVLVCLAVVPSGVLGLLLKKQIDKVMEFALPIALALLVGAVLMEVIEHACYGRGRTTDVAKVSIGQALGIGLAQSLALIPGMSRSASTIMGGLACGLDMRAAADFSFLMSIPTMLAATVLSLAKSRLALSGSEWLVLGVGFVTAFVVALGVVAWFLHFLRNHSFRLFVVYRLILGLIVLVAWSRGWLP